MQEYIFSCQQDFVEKKGDIDRVQFGPTTDKTEASLYDL